MTPWALGTVIRPEQPVDVDAIELIHRGAFGRSEEADVVRALRDHAHSSISLVAERHIMFSPVSVECGSAFPFALALGPMAVRPTFQRRGIGSKLVREGIDACRESGAAAVFVLGHPEYYPRFGFRPAPSLGFHYRSAAFDPAFFVLELRARALVGFHGFVRYHPAFDHV